jgi:hypothetical protein
VLAHSLNPTSCPRKHGPTFVVGDTNHHYVANGNLRLSGRMVSSVMLHRVALVRTDVSEERSASFIRVTRIGELGTALAVTSNIRTLVFLRRVRRLLVTASRNVRVYLR